MSRKKKPRKPRQRKAVSSSVARFAVGDPVRVRHGVTDPDYREIGLGGWSGQVACVDQAACSPLYLIQWDQPTLDAMSPAYRERCEHDGMEFGVMWLDEGELEPKIGPGVPIEPIPEEILPEQPDPATGDRIRAILGWSDPHSLPPLNASTVKRYHKYLAGQLALPCAATCVKPVGDAMVHASGNLVRLRRISETGPESGILCEFLMSNGTRELLPLLCVDVPDDSRNLQLILDYRCWFAIAMATEEQMGGEASAAGESHASQVGGLAILLGLGSLAGACYAAFLGAAWNTIPGVDLAVSIGAAILALAFGLLGWYTASPRVPGVRSNLARGMLASFCGILGGIIGGVLGAFLLTFLGSVPGAILGGLLGRWLPILRNTGVRTGVGGIAGAVLGMLVLCLWKDWEDACTGMWTWALGGAVAAPVLLGLVHGMLPLLFANHLIVVDEEDPEN